MEKLLLYCTKGELLERHWRKIDGIGKFILYGHSDRVKYADKNSPHRLNGKIVAMCDCDLVEKIIFNRSYDDEDNYFHTNILYPDEMSKKSCLEHYEIEEYLKPTSLQDEKKGYALHLSNLNIFDNPKELSEYFQPQNCCMNSFGGLVDDYYPIKKAPQNMMYVYDENSVRYILLPIKPQYLCKILNGEKTIEVRKVVLNALKELIR